MHGERLSGSRLTVWAAVVTVVCSVGSRAEATLTSYTSEDAFLADAMMLGFTLISEGFEDDSVWGSVRSTIPGGDHTAPAILSQGILWTGNNPNSEVTTSSGAARTGDWGFYELPHGDYAQGINDGFIAAAENLVYGFGGWIRTNTPPAAMILIIDGTQIDFENAPLGTSPRFFGVIETDGFVAAEVRETQGAIDDQKLIFADDFTFAGATAPAVEELEVVQPGGVRLAPARPNPFNPNTVLDFTIPQAARITLSVYDATGHRVSGVLDAAPEAAGRHTVSWHGRSDAGEPLASGVYYAVLEVAGIPGGRRIRSLTLVR